MASASESSVVTSRHKFKIVILGDEGVGKTSLLARFMYDTFDPSYKVTIGIDFVSKNLYLSDRVVRLQLWDTAGQERFRSLIPSYIRDSSAAIVAFDVSNRNSFLATLVWINDVRRQRGSDAMIVLVGNKCDIVNTNKSSSRPLSPSASSSSPQANTATGSHSTSVNSNSDSTTTNGDSRGVAPTGNDAKDNGSGMEGSGKVYEKTPGNRVVSYEEAASLAKKENCLYLETSAKTGENVKALFREIAERLNSGNIFPNTVDSNPNGTEGGQGGPGDGNRPSPRNPSLGSDQSNVVQVTLPPTPGSGPAVSPGCCNY